MTVAPTRGFRQWLWRGAELQAARASLRALTSAQRSQLQRAQVALELAQRCIAPVDPLRAGPSLPLALPLLREASYWALAAQVPDSAPADLARAFTDAAKDMLRELSAGDEAAERVERMLLADAPRVAAQLAPEEQRAVAAQAARFVRSLIEQQLGGERRVGRALVQRWVRSTLALVLVLSAFIGLVALVALLTTAPNLAAGKPWKASTTNPAIPRAARGEYFFHTQHEVSPWLEVDLEKPMEIGRVEVVNRTDCCPERAVPAVIEVSVDHTRWKEVMRRTDSFDVWVARFAPVTARYVRVRVLRPSILHLASVVVRAH